MYHVALCDDEQIFTEAQEKVCHSIFTKLNIEYQITTFSDSADFLRTFLDEGKRYDLILLDIIMNGVNGVELAQKIREVDENVAIIFITSTNDYILQGYDVNALYYLEKPVDSEKLEQLIFRDYSRRFNRDFIIFNSYGIKHKVVIKEIIFIETAGKRVALTLMNGSTLFYPSRLAELLNILGSDRFIRCHQSFAINLDNIRELDNGNAITVNGRRIPISRSNIKAVKKMFMERFRDS